MRSIGLAPVVGHGSHASATSSFASRPALRTPVLSARQLVVVAAEQADGNADAPAALDSVGAVGGAAGAAEGPQRGSSEAGASPSGDAPAEPGSANTAAPRLSFDDEIVQYEGSGSKAELAISLLLGATLIYLPLTLASIGRFVWFKYKFTDKRIIVTVDSPIRKDSTQLVYSQIKEVRAVNRFFGLWGDMVFFLKDGSRLELTGVEDVMAIKLYVEGQAF